MQLIRMLMILKQFYLSTLVDVLSIQCCFIFNPLTVSILA